MERRFNVFYKYPLTGPGIAMFSAALEFYSNALRFREANVIMTTRTITICTFC
jgi:hypothetical protein